MKPYNLINPLYIYSRKNWILFTIKQSILEMPRIFVARGFPITANDKRLKALKNIHSGRIGFLIGSGTSVRLEDLERLIDQVTFCCNKFYLAYGMIKFRPTYTFVSDKQMIKDFGEEIVAKSKGTVFINSPKRPDLSGDFIWIRMNPYSNFSFSKNIFGNVHSGGGTLISALQVGYFMGITRFFLYGVDHDFKFVTNEKAKDIFWSAYGDRNHFIKNYRSGKPWCPPATKLIEKSFQICDKFLRSKGGWVKNATRGGKLEVLERLDFDHVLKNLIS